MKGFCWVVSALVISLLASACTSGPGGDPTGSSGSLGSLEQSGSASARLPPASSPAERQVDQKVAAALQARLESPDYRQLRSALVLADGRTVLERYYQSGPADYHHVWSVTKSVVSTLIGIAIARGELRGVEQTLAELLPAYAPTMSPAVAGTTLEQILTMTGGFDTQNPDNLVRPVTDWVAEILAAPYSAPGKGFHYANAGAHLLSAIVVQATGMSTMDYAREVLFDPLGIPTRPAYQPTVGDQSWDSFEAAGFAWPVDPQAINTGGWGLRLRARDLATIGLVYLNNGRWKGQQVVPEDWVREATRAQVATAGLQYTTEYGYLWWVTTADGVPAYAALGIGDSGGQILEVVPSLNLVVVLQSDASGHSDAIAPMLDVVDSLIAPAYKP